jgi:predicted outer membrane repeat protein
VSLNHRLFIVVAAITSAAHADVLYVDDDAPLGGDGSDWDMAYRFLQDALVYAAGDPEVDEIRVAQGIYTADRDEANPNGQSSSNCCAAHDSTGCDDAACEALVCATPSLEFCCVSLWSAGCAYWANLLCEDLPCLRRETFRLVEGVPLRGGYAGYGAPNPDERNPQVYETILSGDLLGNDGVGLENNGENTYQIVTAEDLISPAVLDGFTISAGNGDAPGVAGGLGAGVFVIDGSVLVITECTIESNIGRTGGGIWVTDGGEVVLVESTLRNNKASQGGGALWIAFGAASMERCVIEGNVGGNFGAVTVGEARPFRADECQFRNNVGEYWGGAIYAAGPVVLTNCLFAGNVVNQDASANGTGTGGAIRTAGGAADLEVADCTFTHNSAPLRGAALSHHISSGLRLSNSIVWGNVAEQGGGDDAQIYHPNPHPLARIVRYSNVPSSFAGVGNIEADPHFLDAGNGDFRLSPGSPCIDAGHNWLVPTDARDIDNDGDTMELTPVDLDGNPRFAADEADFDPGCGIPVVVDMGAYEYQGEPFPVRFGDIDGSGAVDVADFLLLIDGWGACPGDCCLADLDLDGGVRVVDFLLVLAHWGP